MAKVLVRNSRTFLFTLALAAGMRSAEAQTIAPDFERVVLEPGVSVEVVERDGQATRGVVHTITKDTLTLFRKGSFRRFAAADTLSIAQRGDRWWDGTVGGAAVGAVVTVVISIAEDCWNHCIISWSGAMLVYGGIGAGIGTLVDSLMTGKRAVFQADTSSTTWRVTPVLGSGRRGVLVNVRLE